MPANKTFDTLKEHDLIIFRHNGEEVRGIVKDTYWRDEDDASPDYAGTITVDSLDEQDVQVREADYVRRVTLETFGHTVAGLWEIARAAADYMIAVHSEAAALREIRRMLSKLDCYMPEAWLGGAAVEAAGAAINAAMGVQANG